MIPVFRLVLLQALSITSIVAAETGALRLGKTVALPNVSGRFDHFAIDPTGKRLFVAALDNNTAEVIDVARFSRVHTVRDLHKPTGVAFLPDAGRLVIANGDDGTLRFFDGEALAPGVELGALDDADNVRFDATGQRLYVEARPGVAKARTAPQRGRYGRRWQRQHLT